MKQNQAITEPEFLTSDQAMRVLQIGPYAFYEGVRTGQIPHVKIGRLIRIPKAALVKMQDLPLQSPE